MEFVVCIVPKIRNALFACRCALEFASSGDIPATRSKEGRSNMASCPVGFPRISGSAVASSTSSRI